MSGNLEWWSDLVLHMDNGHRLRGIPAEYEPAVIVCDDCEGEESIINGPPLLPSVEEMEKACKRAGMSANLSQEWARRILANLADAMEGMG